MILNDIFSGQSNLGYRSLIFMTLNIPCQSLLPYRISFEKLADSLMGIPLYVTNCFSLASFKILSLSLTFGISIMMCLRAGLFGYPNRVIHPVWVSLCFLYLHVFYLHQIREVFFHQFFKYISNFLFFLFSFGSPMICMLECLKSSQRFLTLSSFLGILFFLFFFKNLIFIVFFHYHLVPL